MTTRRTASSAASASLTDILLGLLLIAAGLFLLVGTYLKVIPSVSSLGAFVLAAGVVGIAGALVGRTSAGFFTEVVSGAMVLVLGALILRYPDAAGATGLLVAAGFFLANGLVRVASATEYPSLRGVLLVSGAASLALGAAILADAVKASLVMLAIAIGIELIVDGATALVIGRAEHPHR